MIDRRSIAEARRDLPTLVREAEAGKSVELTRHGQPVAVLVGRREYRRLTGSGPGFAEAASRFRDAESLDELALDVEEIFGGTRDRSRGRDIDL